jgi:hypothetical protein
VSPIAPSIPAAFQASFTALVRRLPGFVHRSGIGEGVVEEDFFDECGLPLALGLGRSHEGSPRRWWIDMVASLRVNG